METRLLLVRPFRTVPNDWRLFARINSCEVNQKHLLISATTFRRGRPPFSPFARAALFFAALLTEPHVARFSPSKACCRKFAKQRRNVDVGVEIGPMKAVPPPTISIRDNCSGVPTAILQVLPRNRASAPSVNFTTNKSSPARLIFHFAGERLVPKLPARSSHV